MCILAICACQIILFILSSRLLIDRVYECASLNRSRDTFNQVGCINPHIINPGYRDSAYGSGTRTWTRPAGVSRGVERQPLSLVAFIKVRRVMARK